MEKTDRPKWLLNGYPWANLGEEVVRESTYDKLNDEETS